MRVEVDHNAAVHKVASATEFGKVYQQILQRDDIRSARVSVFSPADLEQLKVSTW
jgi:hypothetical protein